MPLHPIAPMHMNHVESHPQYLCSYVVNGQPFWNFGTMIASAPTYPHHGLLKCIYEFESMPSHPLHPCIKINVTYHPWTICSTCHHHRLVVLELGMVTTSVPPALNPPSPKIAKMYTWWCPGPFSHCLLNMLPLTPHHLLTSASELRQCPWTQHPPIAKCIPSRQSRICDPCLLHLCIWIHVLGHPCNCPFNMPPWFPAIVQVDCIKYHAHSPFQSSKLYSKYSSRKSMRIQELWGYKNLDPPGALHHEEHALLHNPSEWMHYAFTVAG